MNTKTTTQTISEQKSNAWKAYESKKLSYTELQAVLQHLDKLAYRTEYNMRPEVRAKRKAYNTNRLATEKMGRQLLNQLLNERNELANNVESESDDDIVAID